MAASTFEKTHPYLARWVMDGMLEIGYEYNTRSFIRVLDEGGTVWQSSQDYETVDAALADAEIAAKAWFAENDEL